MIYFVQAVGGGHIKIGTTIRLSKRLGTLMNEFGVRFNVLGVMPGGRSDEAALHQRFSHLWHEREFFLPDDELKAFIASEAAPWDGKDEAPEPDTATVKIDATIIMKAKFVAGIRGVTLSEYLFEILEAPVSSDFAASAEQAMESASR